MQKIVIILQNDGKLESVLSNNEVDIEVLKRDVDDRKIDIAQGTLDEVEIEDEIN